MTRANVAAALGIAALAGIDIGRSRAAASIRTPEHEGVKRSYRLYNTSYRDGVRAALAAMTRPDEVVALQGELLKASMSKKCRRQVNAMFEARLSELRRKALSL